MSIPTLEELAELHRKIVEADEHREKVDYHVVKNGDGTWDIIWSGKASGYGTKEEAATLAREWSRSEWLDNGTTAELLVHGENGQIGVRNTYGHDPRESVG